MQEQIDADAEEQRHDQGDRDADPESGELAAGGLAGRWGAAQSTSPP
jgi:hypothetical protein